MAIDPSISLQLRPVQMQDPIESFGRVLALKSALNQQAMQPLHMQEAQEQLKARQLQNQEAALKQHDDQVTSQTFMQAGGDPAKHVQMAAAAGARPQAVQALQQHYGAIAEQAAKTDQAKLETTKYTNDQILGLTEQATQLAQSDPQQYAALWPQIYAKALKLDPGTAKHFSPDQPPTLDQLQATGLTLKTHANLIQQADEQRKQAAAQREAELQPAKVAAGNDQVAQINREAAARSNPQDPAAQQAALTADQRVTTGATAARNQATAENEARMRAIAEGNLNVSRQHAKIAQDVYNQTYGEGANPALTGVEPKLRTAAASAAQKAADEYGKAMESVHNVQSFIDLARSGNKAAGSNLPIMGAESLQALNGIKRINRTEIEQYQGAGSLLDRIQGRIGKITSGQPIPEDVMKDIESLHKTISGNATGAYNTKLDSINQNYHAQFKPVGGGAKTSSPSTGGHVIELSGKHYQYKGSGDTADLKNYAEVNQ